MTATDLELYRAHEGLTAAAATRRRYADERPYEYYLEARRHHNVLPGSNDDPHHVPAGVQAKLQRFCEQRGYPVHLTTKQALKAMCGLEGTTGLTAHPPERSPDWADAPPWLRAQVKRCAPPQGVHLAADVMTPASLARVTIHEAAHVVSGNRLPGMLEEPVAESVAGLVAGALRMTDGRFSAAYLAQHDHDVVVAARPYAVKTARLLLDELERS